MTDDEQIELDNLISEWNTSLSVTEFLPIDFHTGQTIGHARFSCSYCGKEVHLSKCRGTITLMENVATVRVITVCQECTGVSLFSHVLEADGTNIKQTSLN